MDFTGRPSGSGRDKLRRKYKFTDKNRSRTGTISSILGAVSLLLLGGALWAAYMYAGQAGRYIAIPGFLALMVSAAGLYYGILGTREEDTWQVLPRLGCGMNILALAACVMIYITGW